MNNTLSCERCGKKGFHTKEAIRRHQRRSKICKVANKIAKQSRSLTETLSNTGIIIYNKKKQDK